MKKTLLPIAMYVPLAMLGGAVLFWLSRGVGFLEAIDLSLGILLTSPNYFIWILICPITWIYYFYDRRKQNSSKQYIQQPATPAPQSKNTEPDAKFYEQALAELDSGERSSSIWAKAYAEGADEEHSRKLYVKLRAAQLMNEQTISTVAEMQVEQASRARDEERRQLKAEKKEKLIKEIDRAETMVTVQSVGIAVFALIGFSLLIPALPVAESQSTEGGLLYAAILAIIPFVLVRAVYKIRKDNVELIQKAKSVRIYCFL